MIRRSIRFLAWLALLGTAIATLSPIGLRPHLPAAADLERILAFLVVGFLFALAYPRAIWLAAAVVLFGVVGLEWLQEVRPDRHGRIEDATLKAAGACLGLGCGWIAAQLAARHIE